MGDRKFENIIKQLFDEDEPVLATILGAVNDSIMGSFKTISDKSMAYVLWDISVEVLQNIVNRADDDEVTMSRTAVLYICTDLMMILCSMELISADRLVGIHNCTKEVDDNFYQYTLTKDTSLRYEPSEEELGRIQTVRQFLSQLVSVLGEISQHDTYDTGDKIETLLNDLKDRVNKKSTSPKFSQNFTDGKWNN